MSPQDKTDKTDLGAKVDKLLGTWPAPPLDDAAWEERAASIVAAAQAAPRADDAALTALLAPPSLSPEAGEAERLVALEGPARPVLSGERTMSQQDSNPGSSSVKPPESMPTSAATSKRPSLKELAARASQAGASRPSIPGPSSIPPAAISRPPSEVPPAPVSRTPLPSAPPPRPSEVGKEDSGVVDLNLINKTATAEQIAAAEKAKPATHDLAFEGDEKVAAARPGNVTNLGEAREKKAEKKGGGATWGILVAVVGIAAGVAIVMRGQPAKQDTTTANVGQDKPQVAAEAPKAVEQKIAEAPPPASTGLSLDSLPTEPSADAQKPAQPTGGGAAADSKVAAVAPPVGGTDTPPAATAPAGPAPTIGAKPGDLAGAMAQAVGGSNEKNDATGEMVPAAGGNKGGNQTIPEQPSQGSVASAVGAVMPGAKACVAGADDVSRAQITFSSGGTVTNVSVTGWAASNGQSGCVKAALKGANVGAFSKPSFTVGVTIRP
ncbi:hypothetical protein [Polyangium mundeleinium]|uniref:Transcriptional regulator n=1 Tax=Polyangium mundeleinium TaxID=2995306 RepID=A0ABT5F7E3_9BACT|nr:hypothetical protein [Polyangium mundeleinium]MDC0749519.1 hypothetical protein [Polyangium mundeleinium]